MYGASSNFSTHFVSVLQRGNRWVSEANSFQCQSTVQRGAHWHHLQTNPPKVDINENKWRKINNQDRIMTLGHFGKRVKKNEGCGEERWRRRSRRSFKFSCLEARWREWIRRKKKRQPTQDKKKTLWVYMKNDWNISWISNGIWLRVRDFASREWWFLLVRLTVGTKASSFNIYERLDDGKGSVLRRLLHAHNFLRIFLSPAGLVRGCR